jgi:hypothetical protein
MGFPIETNGSAWCCGDRTGRKGIERKTDVFRITAGMIDVKQPLLDAMAKDSAIYWLGVLQTKTEAYCGGTR